MSVRSVMRALETAGAIENTGFLPFNREGGTGRNEHSKITGRCARCAGGCAGTEIHWGARDRGI